MHPWLNWIEYLTTNQAVAGSNPAGCIFREVAQLGRALGLGPRGRRFESCLPDVDFINPQRPLKTEQDEPNVRVEKSTC